MCVQRPEGRTQAELSSKRKKGAVGEGGNWGQLSPCTFQGGIGRRFLLHKGLVGLFSTEKSMEHLFQSSQDKGKW